MRTKNILIWIVSIFILMSIFYLNSDHYLLKIAKKERDLQIREYDKIEKKYVSEGVYVFNKNIFENKTRKDEFGKTVEYQVFKERQTIKFSFTSEEIIIDFPYHWSLNNSFISMLKGAKTNLPSYNHVKEIIKFSKNYKYDVHTGSWYFYITQWQIVNPQNGGVIYDVIDEIQSFDNLDKGPNYVYLATDDKPFLSSNWDFKTVGKFLECDNNIESYDKVFAPFYCSNFKYMDDIYDLKHYKPRISWLDMINNLINKN